MRSILTVSPSQCAAWLRALSSSLDMSVSVALAHSSFVLYVVTGAACCACCWAGALGRCKL